MTSLIELASDLQMLMERFDELDQMPLTNDGDSFINDKKSEIVKALFEKEGALTTKADRFISFVDNLKSNITQLEEVAKRVTAKRKVLENILDRSMDYAKYTLENTGLTKIQGETATIALHKSPPSMKVSVDTNKASISNIIDVPTAETLEKEGFSDYVQRYMYFVLNTNKMKEDLKTGKELPFARMEQNNHVRIK